MVRVHPDPPVSAVSNRRSASRNGHAVSIVCDQLSAVGNQHSATTRPIGAGLLTAECRKLKAELLFNNSEGKAFMGLDESSVDKKG